MLFRGLGVMARSGCTATSVSVITTLAQPGFRAAYTVSAKVPRQTRVTIRNRLALQERADEGS